MLACQTARMVYQDMSRVDPYLRDMLPADADGDTLPPADAPAPIVVDQPGRDRPPDDQIQVWNATVDWGGSPSINVDARAPTSRRRLRREPLRLRANCIPQPGTSVKLETLSDRIMYRAAVPQLRRLADDRHQPLGRRRQRPRRRALVPDGEAGSGDWGMRDQGTYAPADGLNRWMPSAAMDKSGNIAVGYSTSNGTAPNYPSISVRGPPRDRSAGRC